MAATKATDHKVVIDTSKSPPALRFPPVFNVAVAFIDRHLAEGRGSHPALRTASGEVSYGQLAANVARCGNVLKSLGFARGDRLLLVVQDSPEFFYIFWGAIKAGIVPIAVNTLLKAPDYRYLIENSECGGVAYSTALSGEVLAGAQSVTKKPAHVLSTADISARMTSAPDTLAAVPTRSDEDCFWLYSSGSTGKPKGVVHVHRDMVVTSERYGQGILSIKQDDVVFCTSKLFFSYGFGGGMTFPLWAGATVVPRNCHRSKWVSA